MCLTFVLSMRLFAGASTPHEIIYKMSLERKIEDLQASVEACLIGIRHVQHENNVMKEEFKSDLTHVRRRMDIQYDELSDNIRQRNSGGFSHSNSGIFSEPFGRDSSTQYSDPTESTTDNVTKSPNTTINTSTTTTLSASAQSFTPAASAGPVPVYPQPHLGYPSNPPLSSSQRLTSHLSTVSPGGELSPGFFSAYRDGAPRSFELQSAYKAINDRWKNIRLAPEYIFNRSKVGVSGKELPIHTLLTKVAEPLETSFRIFSAFSETNGLPAAEANELFITLSHLMRIIQDRQVQLVLSKSYDKDFCNQYQAVMTGADNFRMENLEAINMTHSVMKYRTPQSAPNQQNKDSRNSRFRNNKWNKDTKMKGQGRGRGDMSDSKDDE